ncbi:MAG: hypothetical protein Q8M15_01305 [Bacteroidota bacterium]|nr:hypothetical protein [Bacteroidota bacterium]
MKKSIVFSLILFYILILSNSCSHKVNVKNTKFTCNDELVLPMTKNQSTVPGSCQISNFGGKDYISFSDYNNKLIWIYQINSHINQAVFTDSIRYINHFKKGYQSLGTYTLKSLDTIIIQIGSTYFNWVHDTTLFMINRKGQLLATANYEGAPVRVRSKITNLTNLREIEPENANFVSYSGDFPLVYDKRFNSVLASFVGFSNITRYCKNINSDVNYSSGLLYFDERPFKPLKEVHYPCGDTGSYYGLNFKFLRGTFNNRSGESVFAFGNNNNIIAMDTNFKLTHYRINSYILDTIYPLDEYYDEFTDYSRGEFLKLAYDQYKDCYYRIIRVGNNIENKRERIKPIKYQKMVETYLIQTIDTKFNLIAEGIIPEVYNNDFMYFIPYKDCLLFFNTLKSSERGKMVFDKVTLSFQNNSLSNYKNDVFEKIKKHKADFENTSFKSYLTNITGSKRKSAVIFHMENSCRSCIDFYVSYIKMNINKFDFDKISVILITGNKNNLLTNILKINVLPKGIYIDDLGNYKHFLGNVRDAIIIEFPMDKADVIQYEPSEMWKLENKMKDHYLK